MDITYFLGHFGRHNINTDDPTCVAPPKVAKASTAVTAACRCHRRSC
jgi:hypothetical protein